MVLDPFLFSADPALIAAVAGRRSNPDTRVGAVVVDWERTEKETRQADAETIIGTDTQINRPECSDLEQATTVATTPVLCRVDAWEHRGREDLERAIGGGAAEVILPMVRGAGEVAAALEAAAGRVEVGVMIETVDAVESAADIGALPISRAYLGLMDLALERRTPDIFQPLYDGTLETVAEAVGPVPFGFGGLTVPEGGWPIPTRLLAAEMVRLGCVFTFLRRSFLRDSGADPAGGVRAIRQMLSQMARRSPGQVVADRRALLEYSGRVGHR